MLLSTALDALYEKVQKLGKQKYWFLALVLLFIFVTLINGVGIVPEEPYQRLSESPFTTRTDIHFRNNFQETLLLPIVGYFLRLTSPVAFNVLCYLIIASGYAVFAFLVYRRWGTLPALIFSTLVITSPITTILLTWLGMPDGLTVALALPLLFTNSVIPIFILAALGAMNHVVFLIAAGEIIALRWLIKSDLKLQHMLAMIGGSATGILLTKAFLTLNQIEVAPRTGFILTRSLWEWTKLNATHFPVSLFSLFNVQWLAIFVCFTMFFKWDKRFYTGVIVLFVINYGITFFSLDTTRIFSILSTGIFILCLFHSYKMTTNHPAASQNHKKQFLQALTIIGVLSIFSPRYFIWVGEIHATPFYESLRLLIP